MTTGQLELQCHGWLAERLRSCDPGHFSSADHFPDFLNVWAVEAVTDNAGDDNLTVRLAIELGLEELAEARRERGFASADGDRRFFENARFLGVRLPRFTADVGEEMRAWFSEHEGDEVASDLEVLYREVFELQ